jgi:hypothetical protein
MRRCQHVTVKGWGRGRVCFVHFVTFERNVGDGGRAIEGDRSALGEGDSEGNRRRGVEPLQRALGMRVARGGEPESQLVIDQVEAGEILLGKCFFRRPPSHLKAELIFKEKARLPVGFVARCPEREQIARLNA